MRRLEASYTVELALLLPVVIFVLLTPIYMGYDMCAQTRKASISGWEEDFFAEKRVRKVKFIEDFWEDS